MRMRISVVMATWQGRRYLPGQLASLLGQSRPPEELVVVDDASDDDTVEILEEFAARAPFKVHIHVNETRTGSTGAFAVGIAAARGDVIALCDQDDLWMPQKLSRLQLAFREHPDATFAFSDAQLIDGFDALAGRSMWAVRRFHPRLQEQVRRDPFGQLAHRWLVTGCTMAFRRDLRDLALPFPTHLVEDADPMIHDRWLSLVLSAVGPVIVIDEPLVAYRLHAEQQIGLANVAAATPPVVRHSRKLLFARDEVRVARDYQLRHLEEVRRRVAASELAGDLILGHIDACLDHLQFRRDQPDRRIDRLPLVAREAILGRYHRYSRGTASVLVDLLGR